MRLKPVIDKPNSRKLNHTYTRRFTESYCYFCFVLFCFYDREKKEGDDKQPQNYAVAWLFYFRSFVLRLGSIATEYSDVGRYADEDRCCREHDLCPHTLSPGECKRGLCNQQQFTRSHCDCDAKFRRCLQGLNTGNLEIFYDINKVLKKKQIIHDFGSW